MTQIKKVKTSEGVQFYPQTHTKAVVDDDGFSVETRLQGMHDEINAAQFEAGAVTTDLVPTKNSENLVRSGGIYTTCKARVDEIFNGGEWIDVAGGTQVRARITTSGTWNNGGAYKSAFIPITPNRYYVIKANNSETGRISFMKSDTVGSNSASAANYFATGCSVVQIPAGQTIELFAPEDANYVLVYRAEKNSSTDTTFLIESMLMKTTLTIGAEHVTYGESDVKDTLDDTLTRINGETVLDKSTWSTGLAIGTGSYYYCVTSAASNYILSPFYQIYKGDTITIRGGGVNVYSSTKVHIARSLYGFYRDMDGGNKGTVTPTSQEPITYTATEDMVIRLSMPSVATATITRTNTVFDNIRDKDFGYTTVYWKSLIGESWKPTYTVTKNYYIKSALTLGEDNYQCYTSPIALKAGETIHLLQYTNRNDTPIFVFSDSEGNLTSVVSGKKLTSESFSHAYYKATEDCYIVATALKAHGLYITGNSTLQDFMDDYDKQKNGTDILTLYATKETENMMRQMVWGYNSNNSLTGVTYKAPWCIIHCSDLHNNNVGEGTAQSNSVRIAQFFNKYKKDGTSGFIQEVLHTGDSVYASYGQTSPWLSEEGVEYGVDKFLNVIGNHDLDGSASNMVNVYNKYFAPFVESWGVTQPEDAAESGKCYYYKDYASNKIRLIVLMNWNWLASSSYTEEYLGAENTWFQTILEDARTQGLTVVCATHVAPQRLDLIEGCTFNSYEYATVGGSGSATADRFAASVNTFIQAGGDFACWLVGHTHFDLTGTLKSYPDQLCIIVENASCWSYYNADRRLPRTLSQDCFNVMSVDTSLKRVNVMRIGSNFASAMQHKGAFSYDYKNKKLLNCW